MNGLIACLMMSSYLPVYGTIDEPPGYAAMSRPDAKPRDVDSIPFLEITLSGELPEGATLRIPVGIAAKFLFMLGGLNSEDSPHPPWGGGDGRKCFFIGDSAGDLRIRYASGATDSIPLVFGYTVWWNQGYKASPEPFRSDPGALRQLDEALCVANGLKGYDADPGHYYLRIALRAEPVEWIELADNPEKVGRFMVRGLTFANVGNLNRLDPARFVVVQGGIVSPDRAAWLETHTIQSAEPFPGHRREAVKTLLRRYCTSSDDLTEATIAATPPEVAPERFTGPGIRFSGSPVASLLTRIYFDNAQEMLDRVEDDGMVRESGKGAEYYNGFGGWTPGLGAFYDTAYTRNRALLALSRMNLTAQVNRGVDYFDRWMMYYPRAYPDVQLDGKPVPGHCSVIANKPHIYFDELRKVGWRTRYTVRDFGNPENDGHGWLMLTRYRAWVKQGRPKAWVEARWEAIHEAAEYIAWCLDNPALSFSEHGLLHSESEGGMMKPSMYCDFLCYLGLLGHADMAEAAGRADKAARWRELAARYLRSMEAYYPTTVAPWGDVWSPQKNADFNYTHSTLAPAVVGLEYWGLDVLGRMPPGWAERTRRTYAMQLTRNQPRWAAPAGMGYGQCYITQAALLLDEMADADRLTEWMARFCFAPRLPHPYRVPEGAVVAADGSVWRRWGDLGNLYQMTEVVYTILLMAGVDDLDPACLTLMPRLPRQCRGMEVTRWPVRTSCGGRNELAHISMTVENQAPDGRLRVTVQTDRAFDRVRLRLGPFERGKAGVNLRINDQESRLVLEPGGDSAWAWIRLGDGTSLQWTVAIDD